MVPDISRGGNTYGLLAYLYGPGRRDEHTDPHLVAAWNLDLAPDPGRNPEATLAELRDRLDLPVRNLPQHRRPARHVWHCPVRTDPGDRHLTDAEWATVARRILHATGIAPVGDPMACRWVAVRHAEDHIHILATLVRQDGRKPRHHNDAKRAQAECRAIEQDFGLRVLNAGDGTAAKRPTSAERFKAERRGLAEPPRETLREAVRQAVAGAATEEEFFARLEAAGLRVNKRQAPSGDITGYTVALPGDRNRDDKPVWFSGSQLGRDLSLPSIRHRLAVGAAPEDLDGDGPPEPPRRSRYHASTRIARATAVLEADQDEEAAAAQIAGAGEVLDALAQTTLGPSRPEILAAARAFERATRSHVRAERAELRGLRAAARAIVRSGATLGHGEDGGATAMVLTTLVLLAVAAARWHAARGHGQQAAAARLAAEHLRAAYRQAAPAPLTALRAAGRQLPAPVRQRHDRRLRAALPSELAERVRQEGGADALAATLDQAARAGQDPDALLAEAIALRELDTADSVSDVLIWRLRRAADLTDLPGGEAVKTAEPDGRSPQARPTSVQPRSTRRR